MAENIYFYCVLRMDIKQNKLLLFVKFTFLIIFHIFILGKIENFGRVHFGAVQYRGDVILIGGKRRNDAECDTMLTFDPLRAGAETLPDKLPFPNVIDACVKTVINRYHLRAEFVKMADRIDKK